MWVAGLLFSLVVLEPRPLSSCSTLSPLAPPLLLPLSHVAGYLSPNPPSLLRSPRLAPPHARVMCEQCRQRRQSFWPSHHCLNPYHLSLHRRLHSLITLILDRWITGGLFRKGLISDPVLFVSFLLSCVSPRCHLRGLLTSHDHSELLHRAAITD